MQASGIAGRGLFARAAIAPREIVCVKAGHLIDRAGLVKHRDVIRDAELQIADGLFLAPLTADEHDDVMMFLNHSCAPNVGVQGQIVFVAMRAVAPGEELTLDYALIDDDAEPMPCACGAVNCRGRVTGKDWQRPELQARYGEFFAWHLQEKIRSHATI